MTSTAVKASPYFRLGLKAFRDIGVMMLAACCIPGTPGPNRYGPDPRLDPVAA